MVTEPTHSTKRVLVVDDSPTSRKFVSDTLSASGYDVFTANDGEAVGGVVGEVAPDLIVLDIILPKKNGFQVCRELKTSDSTRSIYVVLLSSKSQESDRFWGQRQGADAYLTKPVDPSELLRIVGALTSEEPATTPLETTSN